MSKEQEQHLMDHSFGKSISQAEKCKRLFEIVSPDDVLAVIINADPDSIASAVALKRYFWRKVKKTVIYHINTIRRSDNLALIRLLKFDLKHIRKLESEKMSRWAIVDSQPHHDDRLVKQRFDIIIDHHPLGDHSMAPFVDIREQYGANSSIMTEYLRAAKIKPSPRLATALFYGIKTDTDNFVRHSTPNDIEAFRYLFQYTNISTIKKIEFSEISRKTLKSFKAAIDSLTFYKDTAFVFMGKVNNSDILVIIADFFLKMAEATWCLVAGIYGQKLIVIFRYAGFHLDAGKLAHKLFGSWGPAGGHKNAGRAEVQLDDIPHYLHDMNHVKQFVLERLKTVR